MVETLLLRGYQVKVFDLRITFDDERVQFFTGDLCTKEVLNIEQQNTCPYSVNRFIYF